MTVTLRPHQIAAADAIEAAFRQGVDRPLVNMCVASGKSLTFAEVARRAVMRGERAIIGAHTRELVKQNADACRKLMPGVEIGVNAAALDERCWRAPIICASIQSVHNYARLFGPIDLLEVDEAHLVPHSEAGMYRALHRGLGYPRMPGGSGTTFRLKGGSLVEGDEAPFQREVYRYTIADGIRDGYLCPAFSLGADDKLDASKLRTSAGEYDTKSQDAQMIALMDNHIAQMVHYGWQTRRAWLVFEASTKSAGLMAERMNAWGIPTGLILAKTPDHERAAAIEAFRAGRLRALVNVAALTTGFDVPHTDMLVWRRRTKSLGLYIQMAGRVLRTIGGNIEASIAAGKADGAVLDFAGNIDEHGPLDFIRPKDSKSKLIACEACNARNPAAAARCWSCDAVMTKNCPSCLNVVERGVTTCSHCGFDMRTGPREESKTKLRDTPSGAALIANYGNAADRDGGWVAIRKAYSGPGGALVDLVDGKRVELRGTLAGLASDARWLRLDDVGEPVAILCPNGASRTSARQIGVDGSDFIVPLPQKAA